MSWRVHEPSTTLTDYAITVVAGWLAWRLLAVTQGAAPALLAASFASVALAALLGGTVHGFKPQLGERRWRPLWRATLLLATLTSALLAAAAVVAHTAGAWRALLLAGVVVKLVVLARLAWREGTFGWVVLDSLLTFAAIALIEGAAWVRHDAPDAPWMLGGVAVSIAAGLVQRSGVAPHRHLNHNDLYHLMQLAAVYLFYRGGLVLGSG